MAQQISGHTKILALENSMIQLPSSIVNSIGLTILIVVFVLVLLYLARGKSSNGADRQNHRTPSGVDDETESRAHTEAQRILDKIRSLRRKAQEAIDAGDYTNARDILSKILEHLYRNMAKLVPLGPRNSTEIQGEVEFKLNETTARILLQDLQNKIDSVGDIPEGEMNVLDSPTQEDQLDTIFREGSRLADEVEELAQRSELELIRQEAQLLREELRTRIEKLKRRRTSN